MGPRPTSLSVLVLHNHDYQRQDPEHPGFASRADVENAARQVSQALAARGHLAELASLDGDAVHELLPRLRAARPDLVFNLCESLLGDSRHEVVVPALLDLAGVPYTGSGPLALGLALRKDRAKDVLRARGVPTPDWVVLDEAAASVVDLPFPLIVKPTREDASVGIHCSSVVVDRGGLRRAVARVVEELGQPALVERFVPGRELYVSLLGNRQPRALPLHEIDFSEMPAGLPHIVSYAGKWEAGSPEFAGTRPERCRLDEPTRARVVAVAVAAFSALGLCDYGRVDVRLSSEGTPYVIDVNPNCDLSADAGFSRAASYEALDHAGLVEAICQLALQRFEGELRPSSQRAVGYEAIA